MNHMINFVDPLNLLVEQVPEQTVYDGVDVQAQGYDSDDDVQQSDLHIGTGIFFDINKGDDCEEEPKKKKFWFLPFSVDGPANSSIMVDSSLVVSQADDHGLFSYLPLAQLTGEIVGEKGEKQEEKEPEKEEEKGEKEGGFSQFDDCEETSGACRAGWASWAAVILLAGILVGSY